MDDYTFALYCFPYSLVTSDDANLTKATLIALAFSAA